MQGVRPTGRTADRAPGPALDLPLRMINPIRDYDWGSCTGLATLQGRPSSLTPEAELWMGAHPSNPSGVLVDGEAPVSLADLVAQDAEGVLGAPCAARFGPRLPFLLKVLAVARALSVQVHPGPQRAADGFAREEATGLPLGTAARCYADPFAKPEFVYALTPFDALAGGRPAAEAAALVRRLDVPRLSPVLAALDSAAAAVDGIAPALEVLVHWPRPERLALSEAIAARAWALRGRGDDLLTEDILEVIGQLAVEHPGDVLVSAPLLLRLHHLRPGDTLFLPTGVPHAYLSGSAVEIMATSDNVLRAGLTHKHVAVDELLAALDPHADVVIGHPAVPGGGEQQTWIFPVPDFSLGRTTVAPGEAPRPIGPSAPVPHIVLCTRGRVVVHAGAGALELRSGESAFVAGTCGPLSVSGDGDVFRAAPGPL